MQLVELQEAKQRFRRRGLGLAAVTYDSPATLVEFAATQHIDYPLLADPGSEIIRAFDVLDPDNSDFNRAGDGSAPKDMAYPGYFVIDREGRITAKFFEAIYSDRHTPNNVLGSLYPGGSAGSRVRSRHLTAQPGQSDRIAAPGNRVTLFVEISLPHGVHVYAPGVEKYLPLELRLEPPAPFETRPPLYPAPRVLEIPVIHESVPVYEKHLRVSVDLIVPGRSRKFLSSLQEAPEQYQEFEIPGTLRYQACDAKVCYRPEEARWSWRLGVKLRNIPRASPENRRS
ncbi:MAG TPA: redoxin domain-containing protein [Candidatus Polarisedimenticolia bacterium]|nr:redoxin domain-containing protein [Candidatus Polarisedimenticolia bacterium]